MNKIFSTSYSGATFDIEDDILIKQCRNLYGSGLMQLQHDQKIFESPRVFGLGVDHIAMQYVNNAISLPNYLNICTKQEANYITTEIIRFIDSNTNCNIVFIKPDIITEKINHIITRLNNFDDIILANELNAAFGKSPIAIEIGKYHGDLTFNNILIDSNKKLYLIDFLPGYIPSHWLDIIKLKQEYKLRWSNYFMVMSDIYDYTLNVLKSFLDIFFLNKYSDILRLLEALNYLRILPYTTNNSVIANDLRKEIKNILK